MIEIEAKVRLNKADLERLKKEVPRLARLKGKSVKKDAYYGNEKKFFIRIRQKGNQAVFNIKSKKIEQGTEVNEEVEFPIRSGRAFHALLKKFGINQADTKKKRSTVYLYRDFQIELNHIIELGDYLEIETLVRRQKDIPGAKKRLRALFQNLGFSPVQFEKKYYLELLRDRKKNQ